MATCAQKQHWQARFYADVMGDVEVGGQATTRHLNVATSSGVFSR